MQIKLRKVQDSLGPDLRRLYKNAANKKSLHSAIGLALTSLAKRSFNDATKRPKAWPAKTDGTPARLRKSGTLAKSIRMVSVSARGVTLGSDRRYAAIHQLGGRTKPFTIRPKNKAALKFSIGGRVIFAKKVKHPGSKIPARPYLPFDKNGRPTPLAQKSIREIVARRLGRGLKGR